MIRAAGNPERVQQRENPRVFNFKFSRTLTGSTYMIFTSARSQSGVNEALTYASALSTREFNHAHSNQLHVVKEGQSAWLSLSDFRS